MTNNSTNKKARSNCGRMFKKRINKQINKKANKTHTYGNNNNVL